MTTGSGTKGIAGRHDERLLWVGIELFEELADTYHLHAIAGTSAAHPHYELRGLVRLYAREKLTRRRPRPNGAR